MIGSVRLNPVNDPLCIGIENAAGGQECCLSPMHFDID